MDEPAQYKSFSNWESDGWRCHLFGSRGEGLIYIPRKGTTPNAFVRWMMKICFACTWEKE